jgi:F0F1-type ATP synthase assembly protein I
MISDFKKLVPAVVIIGLMLIADHFFRPSSWTLIVITTLVTATYYIGVQSKEGRKDTRV